MSGLKPGTPDEVATVNPNLSATGEILAYVDGVPMYASENKLDGDVDVKIRYDIVGSDQISGNGKGGDITRTVPSEQTATELVEDIEQQVTVRVFHHDPGQHMMMTFVYAKCSAMERLDLWDHLYYLASDMELPWLVGGDFNGTKEFHSHGGMGDPMLSVYSRDWIGVFFRFLNFWTKHATFIDMVRQNWEADFIGDPFLMFKQNIKRVKAALSKWSRETFVDIFKQLAILEDIVRKYLSIEEKYWKQKARMTLFAEGDRNTSFFHNHVIGKRKKLQLKRIKSGSGVWIEDQEQLATVAVDFYQKQFTNESDASEFSLLNNVPSMVTMDKNLELSRLPTIEEVRAAVFELSGESSSGPDGFSGLFYQTCWDGIGSDIHNMVLHLYGGAALPKSITHTNLVLLPKKPRVETFSNLRPIILSNFINKVLSRVLHDRLESFLPYLITPNQSGFVNGRSIFENILLTQEIITDIRLRGKPANVVIKLDMAKTYDRSSEFFKSTRGVKQGDPLSPALFILSAEVLSRYLNKLFEDKSFVGFGMPKWSDPLNHLEYADDTIIFAFAHPPSLSKIMAVLGNYEKISGSWRYYKICKRRRKDYYEDLIMKVKAKLQSWKGKLLSFGGKATSSLVCCKVCQSTGYQSLINQTSSWGIYIRLLLGSCQNLCLPKEEGALGFRSLHDVSRALFAKLWWSFRTAKSLWSNFMWNKYCKKELPTLVYFRGGSHVWRQMLNAREEVEHEIVWELRSGTTNIWHENWTGLGALYHALPEDFPINKDL
ncbi:uncharacterized protein [Nicotiana tomentosiformis]|uniref:uncharacterized protein n=1 Tax=Nicotiana tomentosiformis TaxID=4098 RepID=UPI00388C880C